MTETIDPIIALPTVRRCPYDPPEEYRTLRNEQPIARVRLPDGSFCWLATRYEDVTAIFTDARFSSDRTLAANSFKTQKFTDEERRQLQEGRAFISMDPPEHTRYRRLLTGQFTVRRMKTLTPRIEQIVADHLDAMAAAGPVVDIVSVCALPIPSLVICELLGIDYADRGEFQERTATMLRSDTSKKGLIESIDGIRAFVGNLVRRKREQPSDDILSGLIQAEPDGAPLTDRELANIGTLLIIAGHETTANMIGLGVVTLLERPGQWAALRANPNLLDNAMEELLRYLTIVQQGVPRVVKEDLTFGGKEFRAGETVLLSLPSSNRDPERFPDPDTFDISRSTARQHLAFGFGIHQCLGQQLARLEMRTVFAQLTQRFPNMSLAVPFDQVAFRSDMAIYGLHSLPVNLGQ